MLPLIIENQIDLPPGTRVQFPDTVEEYEQLLEQMGERYSETNISQIVPDVAVQTTIPQYVSRAWQVGASVALQEYSNSLS